MSNILKNKKLYIGLLSMVLIVILIILTIRYFRSFTNIVEFPRDATKKFTAPYKLTKFSQVGEGLNFAQSFWIYVKDWNYRFMNEKFILNKGGFLIYLGAKNNNLYIEIPVLNNTKPERIVYENLPIQKWVNIVVLLENRYLDIWLNGKLYHSRHLENVPDLKPKSDIEYLNNGGFSGYISRVYHYKNSVSKSKIRDIFRSGPINKNPLYKIALLVKNLFIKNPFKKSFLKCKKK
tara:strand:+ start:5045 stop:5749 length:705 start_codon:yes stop_codon:yes gene_type:complete